MEMTWAAGMDAHAGTDVLLVAFEGVPFIAVAAAAAAATATAAVPFARVSASTLGGRALVGRPTSVHCTIAGRTT